MKRDRDKFAAITMCNSLLFTIVNTEIHWIKNKNKFQNNASKFHFHSLFAFVIFSDNFVWMNGPFALLAQTIFSQNEWILLTKCYGRVSAYKLAINCIASLLDKCKHEFLNAAMKMERHSSKIRKQIVSSKYVSVFVFSSLVLIFLHFEHFFELN